MLRTSETNRTRYPLVSFASYQDSLERFHTKHQRIKNLSVHVSTAFSLPWYTWTLNTEDRLRKQVQECVLVWKIDIPSSSIVFPSCSLTVLCLFFLLASPNKTKCLPNDIILSQKFIYRIPIRLKIGGPSARNRLPFWKETLRSEERGNWSSLSKTASYQNFQILLGAFNMQKRKGTSAHPVIHGHRLSPPLLFSLCKIESTACYYNLGDLTSFPYFLL